jgi:hypothetical protein
VKIKHQPINTLLIMAKNSKYNLAAIFRMAWQFIKQNGMTLSEALRTAWAHAKVKAVMKSGIAHFRFTKVDGSIREAWGTIKSELVPPTGNSRPYNPTLQVYYDTEKSAWRCYKVANIIGLAV